MFQTCLEGVFRSGEGPWHMAFSWPHLSLLFYFVWQVNMRQGKDLFADNPDRPEQFSYPAWVASPYASRQAGRKVQIRVQESNGMKRHLWWGWWGERVWYIYWQGDWGIKHRMGLKACGGQVENKAQGMQRPGNVRMWQRGRTERQNEHK